MSYGLINGIPRFSFRKHNGYVEYLLVRLNRHRQMSWDILYGWKLCKCNHSRTTVLRRILKEPWQLHGAVIEQNSSRNDSFCRNLNLIDNILRALWMKGCKSCFTHICCNTIYWKAVKPSGKEGDKSFSAAMAVCF